MAPAVQNGPGSTGLNGTAGRTAQNGSRDHESGPLGRIERPGTPSGQDQPVPVIERIGTARVGPGSAQLRPTRRHALMLHGPFTLDSHTIVWYTVLGSGERPDYITREVGTVRTVKARGPHDEVRGLILAEGDSVQASLVRIASGVAGMMHKARDGSGSRIDLVDLAEVLGDVARLSVKVLRARDALKGDHGER